MAMATSPGRLALRALSLLSVAAALPLARDSSSALHPSAGASIKLDGKATATGNNPVKCIFNMMSEDHFPTPASMRNDTLGFEYGTCTPPGGSEASTVFLLDDRETELLDDGDF
eukprot:3446634-Prymnesium_polylepis.1